MPELKTKSVAILYNANGTCKYVCVATHVNEKEYNKLVGEMLDNEQKVIEEREALKSRVSELERIVGNLEREIKVLKGEDEDE